MPSGTATPAPALSFPDALARLNEHAMTFQNIRTPANEINGMLRPMIAEMADFGAVSHTALSTVAKDADAIQPKFARLKERLEDVRAEIPSTKESLESVLIQAPGKLSGIFANDLTNWEGGWKGMLGRMGQDLAHFLEESAAQILQSQLNRLFTDFLIHLGLSVAGSSAGGGSSTAASGVLGGILGGTSPSGRMAAPAAAFPDFAARAFAPNFAYAGNAQPQAQVVHHHHYNFNIMPENGKLPRESERQISQKMLGIARRHGGE
jgi:hypothetical protein